jgi:hypothetical protein
MRLIVVSYPALVALSLVRLLIYCLRPHSAHILYTIAHPANGFLLRRSPRPDGAHYYLTSPWQHWGAISRRRARSQARRLRQIGRQRLRQPPRWIVLSPVVLTPLPATERSGAVDHQITIIIFDGGCVYGVLGGRPEPIQLKNRRDLG